MFLFFNKKRFFFKPNPVFYEVDCLFVGFVFVFSWWEPLRLERKPWFRRRGRKFLTNIERYVFVSQISCKKIVLFCFCTFVPSSLLFFAPAFFLPPTFYAVHCCRTRLAPFVKTLRGRLCGAWHSSRKLRVPTIHKTRNGNGSEKNTKPKPWKKWSQKWLTHFTTFFRRTLLCRN